MSFASECPKAYEVYTNGQEKGLHPGMQIYASKAGTVLLDEALGDSNTNGRVLNNDDLMLWMSSSKPIGAIAIAQLMEAGHLQYDDLVTDTIPEFGQLGKDPVTIRHLLTHTGGFPKMPRPIIGTGWNDIIMNICDTPLEEGWIIGETAGYDPHSGWYILAEILQRKVGISYSDYVRERIFLPLGMDNCWVGMTEEAFNDYGERIVPTYDTRRGGCEDMNRQAAASICGCIPGGNGRGPMRELARLYEALLNEGFGNEHHILKAETIADLTRRHRVGQYDTIFRHTIDWGLGFIPNSNQYGAQTVPYGYGLHASEQTFGHGGNQSVAAMADPAHDLVITIDFNGMPGEAPHNLRIKNLLTALYEDLLFL